MKKVNYYLKRLVNWILPRACLLCTHHTTREVNLCQACDNDLPRLYHACQRCARAFSSFTDPLICQFCHENADLPFERTYALYHYQPPITKLIMDLKFGQALMNAKLLSELLLEKILHEWYVERELPQVIIPIPLHSTRLRQRGYNQALEIAKPLAKNLRMPLEIYGCERIKPTAAQATLIAQQRQANVRDAFRIDTLPFNQVAVLDDVITTGATVTAFSHSLKQAGVQTIDIWCCARPSK